MLVLTVLHCTNGLCTFSIRPNKENTCAYGNLTNPDYLYVRVCRPYLKKKGGGAVGWYRGEKLFDSDEMTRRGLNSMRKIIEGAICCVAVFIFRVAFSCCHILLTFHYSGQGLAIVFDKCNHIEETKLTFSQRITHYGMIEKLSFPTASATGG